MPESLISKQCLKQGPDESILRSIDFANVLASGESLTGSPTVTATPSDLTIGTPTISGTTVQFRTSGGTAGVTYLIQADSPTSDSNTRSGYATLVVETPENVC